MKPHLVEWMFIHSNELSVRLNVLSTTHFRAFFPLCFQAIYTPFSVHKPSCLLRKLLPQLRTSIFTCFSFHLCPSVDLSFLYCFPLLSSTVLWIQVVLSFKYLIYVSFIPLYCFYVFLYFHLMFSLLSLHLIEQLLHLLFSLFFNINLLSFIFSFIASCWFSFSSFSFHSCF